MYYNPSFNDYIGRKKPETPNSRGCIWQIICALLIFAILVVVYKS